ncbi:MAG: alanine--tRNA ligase-related protein [Clostridia bacterium]|nr:alanine--tRNA ligase-related protein [Clostridia bacterium]
MITLKLYDDNAFLSEFSAKVLSCEKIEDEKYKIILDKTAFFPEAGGQPCDKGTVNDLAVTDVQIEDGEIYHYVNKRFSVGESVEGKIDFKRRFNFMQNHSGEHIVSGIVFKLFGLNNVGFHLNEELMTLDFDGILSPEQIRRVEKLANIAVWENHIIKTYYPTATELEKILFRQKKEISGDIRLVEIKDVDICACCAPHVLTTGQIGIIKLISSEKMRGGIRITAKCGSFALEDYEEKLNSVFKIGNLLSLKPNEVGEGVEKLTDKQNELKQENSKYKKQLISYIAKEVDTSVFYIENFEMSELQILADTIHKNTNKIITVFSGSDNEYSFVICGDDTEVNELFSKVKENLEVKGGGRNGMINGKVTADKQTVIKEFSV